MKGIRIFGNIPIMMVASGPMTPLNGTGATQGAETNLNRDVAARTALATTVGIAARLLSQVDLVKNKTKLNKWSGSLSPRTLHHFFNTIEAPPPRGIGVRVFSYFFYGKYNFEVQNQFKKVRKPRGVIFPKYEPAASHGDPKSARNPKFVILQTYADT